MAASLVAAMTMQQQQQPGGGSFLKRRSFLPPHSRNRSVDYLSLLRSLFLPSFLYFVSPLSFCFFYISPIISRYPSINPHTYTTLIHPLISHSHFSHSSHSLSSLLLFFIWSGLAIRLSIRGGVDLHSTCEHALPTHTLSYRHTIIHALSYTPSHTDTHFRTDSDTHAHTCSDTPPFTPSRIHPYLSLFRIPSQTPTFSHLLTHILSLTPPHISSHTLSHTPPHPFSSSSFFFTVKSTRTNMSAVGTSGKVQYYTSTLSTCSIQHSSSHLIQCTITIHPHNTLPEHHTHPLTYVLSNVLYVTCVIIDPVENEAEFLYSENDDDINEESGAERGSSKKLMPSV